MAQSIKLKNDKYWDSSSITHNQKKLCDILYPVGSVYISTNSTSPATLFGGKWERLKGGFLYGAVNSYGIGNGSGTSSNSHKLTIDEMPNHYHDLRYNGPAGYGITISTDGVNTNQVLNIESWAWKNSSIKTNVFTNEVGGNEGHSHNIPYIAVFMWRRTA